MMMKWCTGWVDMFDDGDGNRLVVVSGHENRPVFKSGEERVEQVGRSIGSREPASL